MSPSYVLTARLLVPRPRDETYAFFEDPRNLSRITPPGMRFEMVDPSSAVMREGAEFDYTIHWMGLRLPWRSRIEQYQPPERFVDVQLRGPYRSWHHSHLFFEADGGTIVEDRVVYSLPLGLLGRLAHAAVVSRQLRAIFRYRTEALAGILGGDPSQAVGPVIQAATRPTAP